MEDDPEPISFCPYRSQFTYDPFSTQTDQYEVQTQRFELQTSRFDPPQHMRYGHPTTFSGSDEEGSVFEDQLDGK